MKDKEFREFMSEAISMSLNIAEQYEPNKFKAAFAVFGKSYAYREAYNKFKKTGGKL